MGTFRYSKEWQTYVHRVLHDGYAAPAPTSIYAILLANGLTPTNSWAIADAVAGEVANANGYSRQIVGRAISSVDTAGDTLTSNEHGYSANTIVHAVTTNTLPGGLSTGTPYYVINPTTNTFQLSTSSGGSAINLTSTGSGSHYIKTSPVFDAGADLRAEVNFDRVAFSASGGDITWQGMALLANAISTRGDTTGILVSWEYLGSAQVLSNGGSQPIQILMNTLNSGTGTGT